MSEETREKQDRRQAGEPTTPSASPPPAKVLAQGPPRPASLPPQAPPAAPGRRRFVKALFVVGAALSIAPFVPWGQYLSSSVSAKVEPTLQKVVADINATNGQASGKPINTQDLETFPPNTAWLVTYPSSGNLTLDSQNPDTFVKWRIIRLPADVGGTNTDATAFVAFSEVCVHLWCSPNYDPEHSTLKADETFQCPCHGSIYRIPDGLSTAGPASLQPAPTNAIPMLSLSSDASGQLYIEPAVFDVNHNGVIGYGRYYDTYYSYIKPAAEKSG